MIKAVCDGVILLLAAAAVIAWKLQPDSRYLPWYLTVFFLCGAQKNEEFLVFNHYTY